MTFDIAEASVDNGFTETTDIWMDNVVFKEGVE
jgi:hypothetical protein